MKTLLALIVSIISFTSLALAQTASEVINKDVPVTFFGLDYSKAKGILLNARSSEVVEKYMPAINELLIKESSKFNVAKAFEKTNVTYDFTEVTRLNAAIDTNTFQSFSTSAPKLSHESIAAMVKNYNLEGKTGIGLVFVVQTMDKPKEQATYRMVFFTMPDGNVITEDEVVGKTFGFGFRNYWANTFYDVLKKEIKGRIRNKYSK